jgi:hypothetical protein
MKTYVAISLLMFFTITEGINGPMIESAEPEWYSWDLSPIDPYANTEVIIDPYASPESQLPSGSVPQFWYYQIEAPASSERITW